MYDYSVVFGEYLVTHPSLIIIGVTYTIIFAILIYKCVRAKNAGNDGYPYYEEVELLQQSLPTQENDYQNLDIIRHQRNLDRASEALSTDEFEYFDTVSSNPLGQVLAAKHDPLYANVK